MHSPNEQIENAHAHSSFFIIKKKKKLYMRESMIIIIIRNTLGVFNEKFRFLTLYNSLKSSEHVFKNCTFVWPVSHFHQNFVLHDFLLPSGLDYPNYVAHVYFLFICFFSHEKWNRIQTNYCIRFPSGTDFSDWGWRSLLLMCRLSWIISLQSFYNIRDRFSDK